MSLKWLCCAGLAGLSMVRCQMYIGSTNMFCCRYCYAAGTWLRLPDHPLALVDHTLTLVNATLYTVGGLTAQGTITSSIYRYSTSTAGQWKLAKALRVLEWKTHGRYLRLPFTHHCDIFTGALWEEVAVRGGNSAEVTVAGHSTVYHADSDSLIVFGGHSTNSARFAAFRSAFNLT